MEYAYKVADAPLVLSSDEDSQAIENEEDVVAYNIPEEYDSESGLSLRNKLFYGYYFIVWEGCQI